MRVVVIAKLFIVALWYIYLVLSNSQLMPKAFRSVNMLR